jgi:ABC-type antimicrobial peptide transport system permease subunit
MYLPIRQVNYYWTIDVIVRSSIPPGEMSKRVRSALTPISPDLPRNEWRPLRQLVDKSVSPRRFVALLLGGFSVFALLLASLGIYAVVSYTVNQRTQEIGIRMALGASARALQTRILFETLRLAFWGMLFGLAASWGFGRALSGQLYGLEVTDPVTFVGVAILLSGVAAAAGYLPARRASQINPIEALRAN